MIGTVLLVLGFLTVVAVICGILATFIAHGLLWEKFPPHIAGSAAGVSGGVLCAGMVFGLLWALNPDPPERGGRPTVAGTAEMTGFAALFWLPVYLYSYTAVARRHRRRPER